VNRIPSIRLLGALLTLAIGGQLLAAPPPARQVQVRGTVPGQLLVKVTAGPTSDAAVNANKLVGATQVKAFSRIGWQLVQLPAGKTVEQGIAEYQQNPDVAGAEPNFRYQVLGTPNDPMYSQLWGMAKINAPTAWDITTGNSNIVVADIDTGIDYNHPDLAANVWVNPGEIAGNKLDDDNNGYIDDIHGINAVTGAPDPGDPMDDNGHGTHTAGTIGAVGNNGLGVTGINWQVKIMALKFLDKDGGGDDAGALACFDYVHMMKAKGINIRVINNSWGGYYFSQALQDAIDACGAQEIISVCSAGNDSNDNDVFPAYPASYNSACIISVAASDPTDDRASFSNYGATTVDLAAPGEDILSTVPGGGYESWSGTSMAAPHVTGAVALLCTVVGNLTAAQLKDQILTTVDPTPWMNYPTLTGGRLNLANAVRFYRVTFISPPPGSILYVSRPTLAFTTKGMDKNSLQIKVNGSVVGTPSVDPLTGETTYRLGPLASDNNYTVSVAGLDLSGRQVEQSTILQIRSKYLLPGKYMITLPVSDVGSVPSVFSNLTYPQVATWNPGTLQYEHYPQSFADLTASTWAAIDRQTQTKLPPAGRGFWVDMPVMTPLNLPGDILRQERQFIVPIQNGFNMIGNPYTYPVALGSILVQYNGQTYSMEEAATARLIQPVLYWWEGVGYQFDELSDAILQPWVGYWILCRANTRLRPMSLLFQPSPAGTGRPAGTAPAARAQGDVWRIAFNAADLATGQQATMTLGALAGATDQVDFGLDIVAPPKAPDGISLTSRSATDGDVLLRDYRPLAGGASYRWDVSVSGTPGSQIVMNWPDLTGLPKDYMLTLHDQVTGAERYLRTSTNYTVELGAQEQERQLVITATPNVIGSLRISNLQARRTRTNGGASITCQLTQAANVTVEIRTLSGRLVKRLPVPSAQGLVNVTWDGADTRGRQMPRGAYLCHVLAETTNGQKAMAVTTLPL